MKVTHLRFSATRRGIMDEMLAVLFILDRKSDVVLVRKERVNGEVFEILYPELLAQDMSGKRRYLRLSVIHKLDCFCDGHIS